MHIFENMYQCEKVERILSFCSKKMSKIKSKFDAQSDENASLTVNISRHTAI